MNNVEIAFTFDKRIIRGAAVSIKSLLETAKDSTAYLIHIFHSDLTTPICNAFTSMARGTRHKMLFHKIDASIFDGMPKGRGSWTEIVYYRFLIPEILKDSPKFDKILFFISSSFLAFSVFCELIVVSR